MGRGLRTLANGLDHPEGVCWSPAAGAVYAGGEAGQLYRFDLDGGPVETVATVPDGFLLGLAADAGRERVRVRRERRPRAADLARR